MSFEVPKIENYKFYLDVAFKKARTKSSQKKIGPSSDKLTKIKILEFTKIETINSVLNSKLRNIIISFPNFENLTEFYTELVRTTIDYKELKKSLGAMDWANKKTSEFSRQYKSKIRGSKTIEDIRKHSQQYYGRISSVLKQISKNLAFLEETRKIMREFPSIKDNIFTVAIAGFPNVGKSTLLSKITTAKPEIKSYAFTTKKLNMGYIKTETRKAQLIDTPGTLDRFNKMNNIEKIAYLAIKYCTNMIIYTFDLTEPYPLKDQKKLLKKLREFDKPIINYLSKTDILDKKTVSDFKKKTKVVTDLEELKKIVMEEMKKY
ncbi:MAG: 50S ribosome-binding GTPase [Nanoarchaeota archaeon]|nr:50S ribosome-binding GTPase [Nanoarchaeota archaeon]MBU1854866.1 50S ribosome-binding GTPase [Nanoarchaeota archaeon]